MNEVVTEGLERVVETLRRRGLEAGERDGNAKIAQAEAEAEAQLAQARRTAEGIVADAEEDARRQRAQLDRELARAEAAGVCALAHAVERAVLVPAVEGAVDAALREPAVLGELLVEAVRAFGSFPDALLEVRLPERTSARLEALLLTRATAAARGGVRILLDGGLQGGFVLREGRTQLDFSEAAFREVLLGFITPRMRERLRKAREAAR